MDQIDWLDLAQEYGPAALSVVGSILAALFSGFCAAATWAWSKHKDRTLKLQMTITEIGRMLNAYRDNSSTEHGKLRDTILGQRAELHLLRQTVDPIKGGMLNLEGVIKNQNDTINRYVEKMGVVQGQLQAVFKFLDAAPRATDIKLRG